MMRSRRLLSAFANAALTLLVGALPSTAQVCTSGHLNSVRFVAIPYAPATNATPTADQRLSVPSDVQTDLANAFAAASPDFQYKLCGLDGIFIDPSGCGNPNDPTTCTLPGPLIPDYSWGLRTYPPNPSPGKRYIGLSLALWNNKNPLIPNYQWRCQAPRIVCAPPFTTFYSGYLDAVVHMPSTNIGPFSVAVNVTPSAFATNSAMSVLAVLAHEFGHVYWFDTFVPNAGGSFSNNFCGGIFYPSGNWQRSAVSVPSSGGNRFVFFGDMAAYPGSYVPGLPGTLHNISGSGNWASLLAAFSPSEDFVETFELKQLIKSGLAGLQINLDAIVPIAKGSWLDWKLGCFP